MGALRLTNLSTRARVTPENSLLTGFAIRGTSPLTVLVRAAGPALHAFGVAGTVAAPRLRLRDASGNVISENAGWSNAAGIATATATAGAFSFAAGSADSALVAALAPGSYSAEVIAEGGGGVTLVEVYEINGRATGSRLSNLSTLGTVASSDGDVISGFVISGTESAAGTRLSRRYLVRAVGPGLTKLGVAGVLTDPTFTIYNSDSSQVATNDDWSGYAKPNGGVSIPAATTIANVGGATGSTTNAGVTGSRELVNAATILTGAFAIDAGSLDAALVTTLTPGAYTVHMRGVGTVVISTMPSATIPVDTSGAAQAVQAVAVSGSFNPPAPGVALLEIYEVP